ncbi:probable NADH dehydrogenase [ubiquinone] 1 alpha subcomplex subunit 12 [Plutella xylostella]|nr:probable NADH dehydrogenase [ubiquinone] 1 alpha subcomplex subunit 12 [Plutella xylostella]
MSLLGLDKWARLIKIIIHNGGIRKSLQTLWYTDTLKEGEYKGTDCNGNKYYENQRYMIARSRWVKYNLIYGFDYDASQIPPEWYGWLHYKTDRLPCEDPAKLELKADCRAQKWLQPTSENMSGTAKAYVPYSTTKSNICVWDGKSKTTRDSENQN